MRKGGCVMSVSKKMLLNCFMLQSGKSSALTIVNNIKNSYVNAVKTPNSNSIQFIELLGLSVSQYNYGKHHAAYSLFKTAMSYLNVEILIRSLTSDLFYRLRTKKTSTPEEMFHVPLEQRYKVGTQRYSFPGLPCLYMGSSVDVCMEELQDKVSDDYSMAIYKLNVNASPKVFDLSYFFDMDYDQMDKITRQNFLELLPLIALCSIRCEYPKDETIRFKKEYIFPQMLLEYLMDTQPLGKNNIMGIKYRSVYHMNDIWGDDTCNRNWNNYVFPAISNQPSGFSKELQETFQFVDFVH